MLFSARTIFASAWEGGNPIVAVAGAGPAGCATAISLKRKGIPAVVFDKARFPRDKVCGDVLLPSTLVALQELGLSLSSLESQAYVCRGCRYQAEDGPELSGLFLDRRGTPRPSWTIPRGRFDAWLLEQTRAQGVQVFEEHAIVRVLPEDGSGMPEFEVRDPAGEVFRSRASHVVGADGAASAVARALDLLRHEPEHTCLAVRGYARGVRLPEPFLEVFASRQLLPGCAWILPVGPDCANVGLGVLKTTTQRDRTTPAELFTQMLQQIPALQRRLAGAELTDWRGWPLPGATEKRPAGRGRCLLVGDAGAMVDPFTGHGIHHALLAGRVAGETIAADLLGALGAVDAATAYSESLGKILSTEIDLGARLQRVHASAGSMRILTRLAGIHRGFRELFLGLIGHADDRRELLSPRNLFLAALRVSPRRCHP